MQIAVVDRFNRPNARIRSVEMLSIVLVLFVGLSNGWELLERPLVEPGEVIDNRHDFFVDISPKLTMSTERTFKKLGIIDYNVDSMSWEEREENQLKPCLETFPIANGTVPLGQSFRSDKVDNFDDLIQFNGLHIRVPSMNGKFPSEPFMVMMDTHVYIRIRNSQMLNSLTFRVHGLDNEWYEDGEAYLQQCPVPVASEYTYRFTANRQGTMFVRASFPYFSPLNSFNGVLVVKRRNEGLPTVEGPWISLDAEYGIAIQDWPFIDADQQKFSADFPKWSFGLDREDGKCSNSEEKEWLKRPQTLVINGKGWHNQTELRLWPSRLPLSIFPIYSGQNVLFRFAHTGFESPVRIHIEEHDSILAIADGTHTIPTRVDALIIYPGERYNFWLTGKANPSRRSFRIVFQTTDLFPNTNGKMEPIFGLATLRYMNLNESADADYNFDVVDWNQEDCQHNSECLIANCAKNCTQKGEPKCFLAAVMGYPDKHNETAMLEQRSFGGDFEEHFIGMNRITKIDGFTYKPPESIPYFTPNFSSCNEAVCNKEAVAEGRADCSCFYYKQFGYQKIIQLVIYNIGPKEESEREIPFHLHSAHFFLVKVGFPTYGKNGTVLEVNKDLRCDNPEKGCFNVSWSDASWANGNLPMDKSPGLRDTVIIPYGGYIVLRFRAKKAGWFIGEATRSSERAAGLAFAFAVGRRDQMPVPPPDFPTDCGVFESPPLSLQQRETVFRTQNM